MLEGGSYIENCSLSRIVLAMKTDETSFFLEKNQNTPENDYYIFTLEEESSVGIMLDGSIKNAHIELLDSSGKTIFYRSSLIGNKEIEDMEKTAVDLDEVINPKKDCQDLELAAGTYFIKVFPINIDRTKLNLSLGETTENWDEKKPDVDRVFSSEQSNIYSPKNNNQNTCNLSLDNFPAKSFDRVVFVVDETGQLQIDYLYDGTRHKGELPIFNLDGFDELNIGSYEDFIDDDFDFLLGDNFIDIEAKLPQAVDAKALWRDGDNYEDIDKTFECVEAFRCQRFLEKLIATNPAYLDKKISSKAAYYLCKYEALQKQIDRERCQNNCGNLALAKCRDRFLPETSNQAIKILEIQKHETWQQLRQLDPPATPLTENNSPKLAAMQQLIDRPTTAILSFYITPEKTHIFVLQQNQTTCHTCAESGTKKLDSWIRENWSSTYLHQKSKWKTQINAFLSQLAEKLQLSALINRHLSGIEELIVIPHLSLHQIPFAALPIGNSQYLGDKFLIRYIPSCQILESCQKRPVVNNPTYGIVENAAEDLPYSTFEGEKIARLYNIADSQRLVGRHRATVNNYRQLHQQVNILHFSGHGFFRSDRPLESRLELADGSITLGQLFNSNWRMPNLEEVFLSCCETGFGSAPITDEIRTLSTGFLCAGARRVVNTLWAVDDLPMAMFSIFYHQYRHQGYSCTAAVRQGQIDLRNLTGKALRNTYKPDIDSTLRRELEQVETARKEAIAKRNASEDEEGYCYWDREYKHSVKKGKLIYQAIERLKSICQEAFPFRDPFYWAAFTCQGLR